MAASSVPSAAVLSLLTDEVVDSLKQPELRDRLVNTFHVTPPTSGPGSFVADLKALLKFCVSRAKVARVPGAAQGAETRAAALEAEQARAAQPQAAQAVFLSQQPPMAVLPGGANPVFSPPPGPRGMPPVPAAPPAPSPAAQPFDLAAFVATHSAPATPPVAPSVVDLPNSGAASLAYQAAAAPTDALYAEMADRLEVQQLQGAATAQASGFAALCKNKDFRMREFNRLLGIATLCKTVDITTRNKSPAVAVPALLKALSEIHDVADRWCTEMCVAEKYSFAQADAFAASSVSIGGATLDAAGIEARIGSSGFTVAKFPGPKSTKKKRPLSPSSSSSDDDDDEER